MSGGGIFVAISTGDQELAGTTVGGIDDTTGEFNANFIRVIDKTSRKFIEDAEYNAGYIKRARITGPITVQRGTTATYTVVPVFTKPSIEPGQVGKKESTDRYDELKLRSNVPPIVGASVTITKVNNITFTVAYSAGLPANSTAVLQAYFDGTMVVPGKSALTVTIK